MYKTGKFITHSVIIFLIVLASSCQKKEPIVITPDHFHKSIDKVVDIMVHDIFSPPVASRVFVYPNIAAYEIISLKEGKFKSLSNQLNGFQNIPKPNNPEDINYELSALIAHMDLSKKLIFSEAMMESFRDSLYLKLEDQNKTVFENSKDYALQVSEHISQWMDKDNYKETRTMSKYSIDTEDISKWQPTPPAYMDGIEPHWNKIRPLVLDSASQFKPAPPPEFSMEEGTDFYKEVREVYDISNKITKDGDDSEEIEIAQFWDCNPYVSVTRGHLMFATKKITPGAHWIGITKIASKKSNYNIAETLHAYTLTSIAIFDAFISCWDEKYRSDLVRPETLINKYFNDNWKPILQTPPFPEYTSGHSVVSNAASIALTDIFGENFQFDDDTEVKYGLPVRSFDSFKDAAAEATISRMYGGIHYRVAVEVGATQGIDLGNYVIENIQTINE
ncbi:vanadium-dependent haloperoxidase [Mesohalobacter halotolerans]|uniref:Vanadium-dependent haloperoxidase n=1 Tax=Mesohalobacter halotolerans TaxID=1883405 RepID=A0A4U5TNS6_9FLAO|nr:vanadium-dependent haloperoxidase [Mesohalobacter halotolerans]MBS3737493.1 vanadium-dependent haloperoxidase [Psychroflexus sp.]TKS55677.1 vanadium-dependent haloperoxidase [Mesohalobacter halotolerans]